MKCVTNVESTLLDEESFSFKSCDCLPSCNHIEYDYEVIEKKVRDDESGLNVSSSVWIGFGDDEYMAFKRHESYGAVTLLSNIGGLLGLFLGISVLSIIETLYFFTLRLVNDLWYKG